MPKTRYELWIEYNRHSDTDWKGYDKEEFYNQSEVDELCYDAVTTGNKYQLESDKNRFKQLKKALFEKFDIVNIPDTYIDTSNDEYHTKNIWIRKNYIDAVLKDVFVQYGLDCISDCEIQILKLKKYHSKQLEQLKKILIEDISEYIEVLAFSPTTIDMVQLQKTILNKLEKGFAQYEKDK